VSKHLKVLKEAGLVEVRADANRRLYRLSPAPLAEVDHWLTPYRRAWSERLDALDAHLLARPTTPVRPTSSQPAGGIG
jgi:DNA-binding transcriptional ArsR family regulator